MSRTRELRCVRFMSSSVQTNLYSFDPSLSEVWPAGSKFHRVDLMDAKSTYQLRSLFILKSLTPVMTLDRLV